MPDFNSIGDGRGSRYLMRATLADLGMVLHAFAHAAFVKATPP
jgi:hypothetical protein